MDGNDQTGGGGPAARKDRGGRVRKDPPQAGGRSKRSVMLSDDAWERLSVHAIRERTDNSALVEMLVSTHLRRYVVQDRGRAPLVISADGAAGVNFPVETVAVPETLHPLPDADGPPPPGAGEGEARRGRRAARQGPAV